MKPWQACVTALIVVLAAVARAEPTEGEREPPADEAAEQARPAGQRPAAPAAGFTPSERIEADSAVTFPVDI